MFRIWNERIEGLSDEEPVYYLAPIVQCNSPKNDWRLSNYDPDLQCHTIFLPYPVLPPASSDESDEPIEWPALDWKRPFVCIECGLFQEFSEADVGWVEVMKSTSGRYRNDTNCYSVEISCSRPDCRTAIKFYVELHDRTEADLRKDIKKGFMGSWPSGHPALANPHQQPKIERIYLGPI
jgi:hypothetical protein